MIAAWRRGGTVDNVFVPTFMALGAFPAFFTALLALYFLGLKAGWFPIQHAYDTGLSPGFNWTFLSSAFRHGQLPILVIVAAYAGGWVLNMRTVMINTISEDYVALAQAKGLSDRRVMTRYAGPQRDPAAAERIRGAVRERRRRPRLRRVHLQLSRRRLHAAAGGARQRLRARAGAARRPLGVRDHREPPDGHPQPDPRPAPPYELMSQLDPTVEISLAAAPKRISSRLRVPGWAVLLLQNRKSRLGPGHARVRRDHRADRAADLGRRPERLRPARGPAGAVVESPVRNDGPGKRHLLAGRARRTPLAAARRGGRRARDRYRRGPRYHGRLLRRRRRRGHQLPDQRLPDDPGDPAADRHRRLPAHARNGRDDRRPRARALGVRGADPARPGSAAEEPRLRPRGEGVGRVGAPHRVRRADAEHDQPHRRRFRARLLHRTAHRRRARVPRARRHVEDELGRDALLGADELDGAAG